MTRTKKRRWTVFATIAVCTAVSMIASAQTKKGHAPRSTPAKTTKKAPSTGARAPSAPDVDGGEDGFDGGSARAPKAPVSSARTESDGGAVVETKKGDGGVSVFRFGEVELEGRLKSPQIVYFLRRVRAEFAATDLGHRTFTKELHETRNEPSLE